LEIGRTKGKEYTQTDRLDNFKRLGKELGVDPKVILWVYLRKHIDSIASFIKTGGVLSEPIQGRITDARVYLFLLRGLIEEDKQVDEADRVTMDEHFEFNGSPNIGS